MNNVSRREFVKAASAVTAVTATTLPTWAVQEKRDPIKIGFIGCGGRGTGAANQALTANESAVIWSMGDAFEDRLVGSMNSLIGEQGERAKVPRERQFVG
ncbi:MAG: twin-arginine translocation signal domain-containing protein, partial [Planctomycetes bacterium]|nr:twin-arginine translocation signal domain-containing protein [Planctomycetota bacterium]